MNPRYDIVIGSAGFRVTRKAPKEDGRTYETIDTEFYFTNWPDAAAWFATEMARPDTVVKLVGADP